MKTNVSIELDGNDIRAAVYMWLREKGLANDVEPDQVRLKAIRVSKRGGRVIAATCFHGLEVETEVAEPGHGDTPE
jgi:hypothetical protein